MNTNLAKHFPTETPIELLRRWKREGLIEVGRVCFYLGDTVSERKVSGWVGAERKGRPDDEELLAIRRGLRRDGKHGMALELARAEMPDFDITHPTRQDLADLDADHDNDVDAVDCDTHVIETLERLTAALKASNKRELREILALMDSADLCLKRGRAAWMMQAAKSTGLKLA